jgi:hypothetical protein
LEKEKSKRTKSDDKTVKELVDKVKASDQRIGKVENVGAEILKQQQMLQLQLRKHQEEQANRPSISGTKDELYQREKEHNADLRTFIESQNERLKEAAESDRKRVDANMEFNFRLTGAQAAQTTLNSLQSIDYDKLKLFQTEIGGMLSLGQVSQIQPNDLKP